MYKRQLLSCTICVVSEICGHSYHTDHQFVVVRVIVAQRAYNWVPIWFKRDILWHIFGIEKFLDFIISLFLVENHCSASCLSSCRSTQLWKDFMAFSNVVNISKEVWWKHLFIASHRTQINGQPNLNLHDLESTSDISYLHFCF